jgi:hypothetical protein
VRRGTGHVDAFTPPPGRLGRVHRPGCAGGPPGGRRRPAVGSLIRTPAPKDRGQ